MNKPNIDNVYFDLTCDVIGDLEFSEIRFRSTVFPGLSDAVWILMIGPVVSELGGGGLWIAPPPPSRARYTQTPVERGLTFFFTQLPQRRCCVPPPFLVGEVGAMPELGQSRNSRYFENRKTWMPPVSDALKLKWLQLSHVCYESSFGILRLWGRQERFQGTCSLYYMRLWSCISYSLCYRLSGQFGQVIFSMSLHKCAAYLKFIQHVEKLWACKWKYGWLG